METYYHGDEEFLSNNKIVLSELRPGHLFKKSMVS